MDENTYAPTVEDALFELHANATSPRSYMSEKGFQRAMALVKAEVLREASAAIYNEWSGGHAYEGLGIEHAEMWLDERANKIENKEQL